jgi:hypothetical protein
MHYPRARAIDQKSVALLVFMPWTPPSFWILPVIIAAILGALSWGVARSRLRSLYTDHFPETWRERLFLASLGFFVTIVVVRAITEAIHRNIGPFHDVSFRGRHIHHLVWGIILLLSVGYAWLLEFGTGAPSGLTWAGRLTSMLYGVASALTLDEFALWLNLRDVYWEREGRECVEAIALFGGLLSVGIFGKAFFRAIAKEAVSLLRSQRHHQTPQSTPSPRR